MATIGMNIHGVTVT